MKICQATADIKKNWDEFAASHPDSHPFYAWDYADLLRDFFGMEAERHCLLENGYIRGIFPLFKKKSAKLFSLPFADYGGPLAENPEGEEMLWPMLSQKKYAVLARQKANCLQDKIKADYCHFTLDCGRDFATTLKHLISQKTRNMINKSRQFEMEESQELSEENLEAYCRIYHETMIRLNRLPLPQNFIKKLPATLKNCLGFFRFNKSKMLAGILAFEQGQKIHVWSNAQSRQATTVAANYAVYADLIKYACAKPHIKVIDFGCSEKNSGQAFFKKRWGGEEKPLYLMSDGSGETQGDDRGRTRSHGIVISALNRLPRPLNQKLAKFIFSRY